MNYLIPFIIASGYPIGKLLKWNSPEEINPGKKYFKLSNKLFLISTYILSIYFLQNYFIIIPVLSLLFTKKTNFLQESIIVAILLSLSFNIYLSTTIFLYAITVGLLR